MYCEKWNEITYPGTLMKFGNGYVISSYTLLGMWILIPAYPSSKLIHVGKMGPRWQSVSEELQL